MTMMQELFLDALHVTIRTDYTPRCRKKIPLQTSGGRVSKCCS